MKLNNKGWGTMEMILLSCGLLIALIISIYFISQLYGSFDNAFSNGTYSDLEVKLADAAKKYVENNDNINLPLRLSLNDLKNYGFINEFKDSNGNECNGYVIITENFSYNYSAYISCPNYTTENY